MSKYAIWNKKDPIITPVGQVFTAEQWKERYPVARLDSIDIVCGSGEINGSFFGTLGSMVNRYENEGCDFSACKTAEDKIKAIEDFEDARDAEARERARIAAENEAANAELNASSLASIAAQLEYQNMMTLDDIEEV